MRTALLRLTTLAAALVSLSPPMLQAQEGIFVTDFSTPHGPVTYPLAGPAKARRGVTSTVEIVKNLIDLVPFDQIKIHSGPTTISGISNGRTTSSGTGFIRMSMTVPAGVSPGSTVTLDVGFLDHFNFTVEHTGQLSAAPSFTPSPTTVVAGTQIVVNGSGVDFGTPSILALCHSVVMGAHDQDSFTATLTRQSSGTCSSNNGPFALSIHGSGTGDPSLYATSQGVTSFSLPAYFIPPPPPGLTCSSVPNIGPPNIIRPVDQQVFEFATGANASQQVSIVWSKHTANSQLAPNNDWIVSVPSDRTVTGSINITIRDTVVTRAYVVPGTYTVSIRAKNCDTSAASKSVTFGLKFH
jgi:hypothetical protein